MKRIFFTPIILTLFISIFLLCSFKNNPSVNKKIKTGLISDTLDVLNYSIHLDIIYLSKKSIKGYTELTVTPKTNNVNSISLYLLKLNIDSITVNNTIIPSFGYNDTLLRFSLLSPININDTISLKVYYNGKPVTDPSNWGGFYFSADSNYAYNLGVAFQDVPHNYGRVWFPCIDDFIDRATYDYYIRTKNTKTAVCGGTLMNETDNGDGTKTFYWRMHNEIPTYLASVAVGPYVPIKYTFNSLNGNIPVKIYVNPTDSNKTKSSFVNLLNILSVYENNFGPYMWERVGYVAVPFNNGAMEHAANIAYPAAAIDGTLANEELYAHELSHHWFGDLVTCATAEDMWINEGWATYCEAIYVGGLNGYDSYMAKIKSNHYYSLNNSHIDDGGYYAIYGIPASITYGSTVYKNGGDIIHTLRYYLGDSLFFSTVKSWLVDYKYKHISTDELRDYITAKTGINVSDFFEGWIKTPGFPHFSIDSVKYTGTGNDYKVYVRQKFHHRNSFVNSNKIEITFMNDSWQSYAENIEFSGEYGNKIFHLPFVPTTAMIDLNEKVSDATTDYYKVLKTSGTSNFPNSFFSLIINNISDSAFFHVEHNWVAPDALKNPSSTIFRISDKRYWKIDGIIPQGFDAQGRFTYNRYSNGLDNSLLPTAASADSLVLLYRENTKDDWRIVNFIKAGTSAGNLTTNNLMKGEYTFGVGLPSQSGITEDNKKIISLDVFPNPSDDIFNINYKTEEFSLIKIYDSLNKLVYSKELNQKQGQLTWTPGKIKKGVYYIYLYTDGKPVVSKKIIYTK
ncbi:MAG TPA: M1 family aminopeptidase [Bacteroidales bacterium]|nr:M1 family aminopeptidase [Bacteroidales bacterium]HPS18133.1 M1 family aminopeptidase [Bacteroidales bacterium]